jgi:AI-2 transport protein TqsA
MVVKDGSRVLMTLGGAVVIAAGLYFSRIVIAPVLLAGFVAAITAPLVRWLTQRKVPLFVAVVAGLFVDGLVLAAIGAVIASAVADITAGQERYAMHLADAFANLEAWAVTIGLDLEAEVIESALDPDSMVETFGMVLKRVLAVVSQLVLLLLLVGFMLSELGEWSRKVRSLLHDREDLEALRRAGANVRGFLRVKFATSAITGILATAVCLGFRVDLAILWGVMAFLLNFIPNIGSIIAALPPIAVALLIHGPLTAGIVAGCYLAINMVIGSIIEPKVMGDTLGLSALVVFVGLLFWGWILGPIGALLSPPLMLMLKTWLEHTRDLHWMAVLLGSDVDEPGALPERDSKPPPVDDESEDVAPAAQ